MLKKFDPRYEPPSRNYISRTSVPGMYAVTVKKFKEKLMVLLTLPRQLTCGQAQLD